MDYNSIKQQFDALPATFKRFGPNYVALIASICTVLARYCTSTDWTLDNINLVSTNKVTQNPDGSFTTTPITYQDASNTAKWGWLDSIAKLYGLTRNKYEVDNQLRVRVLGTLTAPHGTPESIVSFLQLALNLPVTVTENFVNPSYQLNFLIPPSNQTLQEVADAIAWVRPAGIPFLPLFTIHGGLFIHTCNYLDGRAVSGSYLSHSQVAASINLAPNTNNPKPLLPTTYLTDPYLTGAITV